MNKMRMADAEIMAHSSNPSWKWRSGRLHIDMKVEGNKWGKLQDNNVLIC